MKDKCTICLESYCTFGTYSIIPHAYTYIYINVLICHLLDLLLIREVKKPVISETRSATMLPYSHTHQTVSNLNCIIMNK